MADNSLEGWISKQINNGRTRKDIASLLNEHGFKTEEGGPITSLDISRHLAGAENIVIPPNADLPAPAREKPSPSEKIAALVEEIAPRIIDQDPGPREDLKDSEPEELEDNAPIDPLQGEDDEFMPEPLEYPKPARVPSPEDHSHVEHVGPAQHARVSGIFSPRAPVELEEDGSSFFNIPRLKRKPVEVRTRPYEPKIFGSNVISTKDLNVRKRKPS